MIEEWNQETDQRFNLCTLQIEKGKKANRNPTLSNIGLVKHKVVGTRQ